MKNNKLLALCLSLVCAFVLAGVLATTALAAPVTYYVGSAAFDYQGVTHTPDYATVEAALTAMGTNGGTIIFTGSHSYLDTHLAKVNNAPYVTFIGADSTATLVISNKSYYHRTQATYQHLTLQLPNNGGVYFLAGDGSNRSITIGSIDPVTGLGANDVTVTGTTKQFYLAGNAGWGPAEDVTINSGRYDYIGATYGNASTASNSHVTINGGTMPSKIVAGAVKVGTTAATYNIQCNITLTLNGGTYNATQYITVNENSAHTSNVTGKTSVIINNGLASTYNFVTTELDYTIKSTADGFVELETEGSSSTAPTFLITADDTTNWVYVNGVPITTANGVAHFTPESEGTYDITYAPYSAVVSLTFDANGGSGSQAAEGAEAGEEVTLPATTTFTAPAGKYFAGWGATADATIPVATPYYMPATDTVLYAIWYDAVYANSDGSGLITVGGKQYIAYTSITDAINALGTAGGKIVFDGTYAIADIITASKATGSGYTFVGVDVETSKITVTGWHNYNNNMTFENLRLQGPATGYIMLGTQNGKTTTYGGPDGTNPVVVATSSGGAVSQLGAFASKGWTSGDCTLVINSGTYNFVAGTSNATTSGGNLHIVINGGTMPNKIVGGAGGLNPSGTKTLKSNITVTLNGGTFHATTNVLVSGNAAGGAISDVTGKTSVIINNGLADTHTFNTSEYDYTLKSTADGFVELTTEGSADTAPTFTITANDTTDLVYINDVPQFGTVGGVYAFTPDATGTYDITYGPAPAAFADSSVSKAGYVAATEDAASKTYAIIASVQLADWVDVANISSIGFYGYTADSETAKVTLAATASVQSDLTNESKRFYAVIDEIPAASTSVVLKPFVVLNGTVTCAGSAAAYVPDTIGASTYYGTQDELDVYFG